MNPNSKTVLQIDLTNRTSKVKIYKDLNKYIGGIGLALALMVEIDDPEAIVFCTGPMGGFFPYVSKTVCAFLKENELHEAIGGGRLALVMGLAGLDAIVVTGKSEEQVAVSIKDQQVDFFNVKIQAQKEAFKNEGLPSKRSLVEFTKDCIIDSHFSFGSNDLTKICSSNNLEALMITGTQSFNIASPDYYRRIYFEILSKPANLAVPFMGFKSCAGCPAGCRYSKNGEGNTNVAILPRCLVSCQFAQNIYNDIPLVFSCLSSLGYYYNHEDLEGIAEKVGKIYGLLNRKLESK